MPNPTDTTNNSIKASPHYIYPPPLNSHSTQNFTQGKKKLQNPSKMEGFGSKSYRNGRSMQADDAGSYYGAGLSDGNGAEPPNYKAGSNPSGMQDLRCYSTSYATSSSAAARGNGQLDIVVAGGDGGEQWKFKKGKSTNGVDSRSWTLTDPELQRKKRVASYKAYTVEGKVKGSFKKSFRWIKERYTLMLYGYR